MKSFTCDVCDRPLHFEEIRCESCGARQGYDPGLADLVAVDEEHAPHRDWAAEPPRFCANAELAQCNWFAAPGDVFCAACRYNRTVPDVSVPGNALRWQRIEAAKRRMLYGLFRLGLRPPARRDSAGGLAFDFLSDGPGDGAAVSTGHHGGLITLNIAEADDVERERIRLEMKEPYRTLLGHFRHEVGHYVWQLIAGSAVDLARFRATFGDERADYTGALRHHYAEGAPAGWQHHFVSPYASSHPWEDFAETWAHFMHMVDTLETANGLTMSFRTGKSRTLRIDFDPYAEPHFAIMVEAWMHLAFGLNALSRSMGTVDLYPFSLSPPVIAKLTFIHEWLGRATGRATREESADEPLEAMAAGLRSGHSAPAPAPEPCYGDAEDEGTGRGRP